MTTYGLAVMMPCISLEDFPLDRKEEDARQLLTAWTALWHPRLIAATGTIPQWVSAECPPEHASDQIILVPSSCKDLLPSDWVADSEVSDRILVDLPIEGDDPTDDLATIRTIIDRIVELLPKPADEETDDDRPTIKPLTEDAIAATDRFAEFFFDVAYSYFVVEIITRRMNYMSNLDEESFTKEVIEAAEAATTDDEGGVNESLGRAIELIHESREYFYPVESNLLDLTLTAQSGPLAKLIESDRSANLLVSGQVLEQLADESPEMLEKLREAVEQNRISIAGGERTEAPLPLMPLEAVRRHLIEGIETYRRLIGRSPKIFGRWTFGLWPTLPRLLRDLEFESAIHYTLDGGKNPSASQSRFVWKGLDGTTIEALGRLPIDVGRAQALLRVPEDLSGSMDHDSIATVVMAHQPGKERLWYESMQRTCDRAPTIGTFQQLEDYFEATRYSGYEMQPMPDQYRSPYLWQATERGEANPISRWVRYYRRRAAIESAEHLEAIAAMIRGKVETNDGATVFQRIDSLFDEVETGRDEEDDNTTKTESDIDARIEAQLQDSTDRFGSAIGARPIEGDEASGILIVNASPFPRRLSFDLPAETEIADEPSNDTPLRAKSTSEAVAVVPTAGFAWLKETEASDGESKESTDEATEADASNKKKKGLLGGMFQNAEKRKRKEFLEQRRTKLACHDSEGTIVRNEHFQAEFDPNTGAMIGLIDYKTRGARIAQQIALRSGKGPQEDSGADEHYSIMAADRFEVLDEGPLVGRLLCEGRLVSRSGKEVGRFRQTTTARRGSRVLQFDIELELTDAQRKALSTNPWSNYYGVRLAWNDETVDLTRGISSAQVTTDTVAVEAPQFVDMTGNTTRTTILAGGLPYHRRHGLRKMDTLLVVAGETESRFQLGIAIDAPDPTCASQGFLAPETILTDRKSPATPSGWTFHLDRRGVLPTSWRPVVDDDGRVTALTVRLLETRGTAVDVGVSTVRPIKDVQVAGTIAPAKPPSVEDDRAVISLRPYEWIEAELQLE